MCENKNALEKEMDEKQKVLEKEIDLIQGCINRMAQNSFVVKGWLITLVTVVLALFPERVNINILCYVIIIVTIAFWYLDGFFLKMEKLYRWKYEWVIHNRKENDKYKYDLNPYNSNMWQNLKGDNTLKEPCVIKIMFTKTLVPLYGLILALAIFVLINAHFEFVNIIKIGTTP